MAFSSSFSSNIAPGIAAASPTASFSSSLASSSLSSPFISQFGSAAFSPTFTPPFAFPPIIGPFVPTLPILPTPTSPTPTQPASPTATASDLQVLISSIPIAQDGHVITADFHNALRLALVAIANRMGIGPVAEEITITNAPRLLPASGAAAWDHAYGVVSKPDSAGSGNVRGWMELELPDGARIKKMMVFGTTDGGGTLRARLRRQKITDPSVSTDLIVIDIPDDADASKGIEGDVTVPGTGAGAVAIEEYRIVNNREQKYLLAVELDGVSESTTAQFNAVQIVCGR